MKSIDSLTLLSDEVIDTRVFKKWVKVESRSLIASQNEINLSLDRRGSCYLKYQQPKQIT